MNRSVAKTTGLLLATMKRSNSSQTTRQYLMYLFGRNCFERRTGHFLKSVAVVGRNHTARVFVTMYTWSYNIHTYRIISLLRREGVSRCASEIRPRRATKSWPINTRARTRSGGRRATSLILFIVNKSDYQRSGAGYRVSRYARTRDGSRNRARPTHNCRA